MAVPFGVSYTGTGVEEGTVNGETSPSSVTNANTSDGNKVVLDIDPIEDPADADDIDDYVLPDSITVTIGGNDYTIGDDGDPTDGNGVITDAETGITYNPATGEVTIPDSKVDGNITIQAVGIPQYTVTYTLTAANEEGPYTIVEETQLRSARAVMG